MKQGGQFLVVMTDRFTELTKAIATANIEAATVVCIFREHWVVHHDISSEPLIYRGSQFLS